MDELISTYVVSMIERERRNKARPTQAGGLCAISVAMEFEHDFCCHVHPLNVPSGYVKIAIENGHRNSWFTH